MKKMILPVLLIAMLILTTTVSAYTFGTGMKYIRGIDSAEANVFSVFMFGSVLPNSN